MSAISTTSSSGSENFDGERDARAPAAPAKLVAGATPTSALTVQKATIGTSSSSGSGKRCADRAAHAPAAPAKLLAATTPTPVPAAQKAMIVVAMVVFGASSTLLSKSEYMMWSINVHGDPDEFRRPWAGVAGYLVGMSLVETVASFGAKILRSLAACGCDRDGGGGSGRECEVKTQDTVQDIEAGEGTEVSYSDENDGLDASRDLGVASSDRAPNTMAASHPTEIERGICRKLDLKKQVLMGCIPAVLNLIATPLSYVALLYITASVWQMLRGASIIFSALLSIVFLKAKLGCSKWLGAWTCLSGVFLVGLSNLLSSESEDQDPAGVAKGIGLMILSQLFLAATRVAEEYLVKKCGMAPTRVVSLEGAWGFALLVVFIYPVLYLLPGADDGHADDIIDTLVLLKNNQSLIMMFASFILASLGQNLFGIMVSAIWSSVQRMMLDGVRSCLIWTFGLTVNYFVSSTSPLAEAWTSWSRLELLGFVVILLGQLLYGGVVKRFLEIRATLEAPCACPSEAAAEKAA